MGHPHVIAGKPSSAKNMQTPAEDNDRTLLRRPVAPGIAADVPMVDPRHIGEFGAINPLIGAANPLLMMVPVLRTASVPTDVSGLRARLIEMVKGFDATCLGLSLPDDQRNIARYAVCTVLDEAIQMTPWGGTANWAQQSLLIHFFKENWGGEKFFQILDKMSETPSKFGPLLELFYVCLSLGFMGRFQMAGPAGRQAVGDLRDRLYILVRQGGGEPERNLSSAWKGLSIEARGFKGFWAFGLTVGLVSLLSLGTFAGLAYALGGHFSGLGLHQLALKQTPLAVAAAVPASKPRLAQLLAPEIESKQVQVRDMALESVVTLLGETLFESGSAAPKGQSTAVLNRVAEALDQVEGQILVTGHTDNTPTRTLRYANNFELSRERAENARRILAAKLKDSARITSEGRGDTEPVAGKGTVAGNDSAEKRALNRRVEITLRVSSPAQ